MVLVQRSAIQNLEFVRAKLSKQPSVKWEIPQDVTVIQHFLLIIIEEVPGENEVEVARYNVLPPGGNRLSVERNIHEQLSENTHRAEVCAVDNNGNVLEKQLIRFVVEQLINPQSVAGWPNSRRLLELQDFTAQIGRPPVFLVIGKQHDGKSSLVNHLNRCSGGRINVPDLARAAPPSNQETTIFTQKSTLSFPGSLQVTLVDTPAFGTMEEKRQEDLINLLYNTSDNARRGEFASFLSSPPDGVIVVVSLISLREREREMKEYFLILQRVLGTFPFVVAATHRDAFLLQEGKIGKDPLVRLEEAIHDLREIANTNSVFAIANYHPQSWWAPAVDTETVELLEQLTSSAKRRRAPSGGKRSLPWIIGSVIVAVVAGAVMGCAR